MELEKCENLFLECLAWGSGWECLGQRDICKTKKETIFLDCIAQGEGDELYEECMEGCND